MGHVCVCVCVRMDQVTLAFLYPNVTCMRTHVFWWLGKAGLNSAVHIRAKVNVTTLLRAK